MKRRTWISLLLMTAFVAGLIVLLLREAASGPTFRAEDYGSYAECVRNIPTEWRPGSVEYLGAEAACGFVQAPHR